jgi:hypothetical protein
VRLVLGQDGAQMPLTEDQHPVEEFSAQRSDEALADQAPVRPGDPRRAEGFTMSLTSPPGQGKTLTQLLAYVVDDEDRTRRVNLLLRTSQPACS